jgi:2-methylcitrate dehydratase PrpD
MGLTRELGEFVSRLQYVDLPTEAVGVAKLGFVDCIGVMIAGSVEQVAEIVARTVLDGCEKREASIFFSERRAPAALAAWVNGTAAHALDYDDAGGHRSAVLVPTLLAEGEALGSSGAEMIAAYVAGFEVWSELALREKGHLHERGWHPTGMYGALAAAAAAARLRRLDGARTATALAIAASQASGLVANFGSMVKPFHAGNSARAGIFAARLSQNGMTASANALEHERGFLSAVSQHGEFDRARPASTLGQQWCIAAEGVSIKKFPTCYCTHRAIDGMLDLATTNDLRANDVEGIEVLIGKTQKAILHADAPTTGLEAKFSIQFAAACALLERKVTLSELVDTVVQRADVQALMKRVKVTLITEYDGAMPQYAPYDQVKVRLKSGTVLEGERVKRAKGHISRPLSEDELFAKFSSCLDFAASELDPRQLFETLSRLDGQPAGWLTGAVDHKGRTESAAARSRTATP